MTGLSGYNSALEAHRKNQQTNALIALEQQKANLTEEQVRQARDKQKIAEAIAARFGQQQTPQAQPQMGVSDNSAMALNAPWAAASTLPQPEAPSQQFPFSLGEMAAMHAGAGIDLLPYYKESRPDIKIEGGIMRDMKTGKILGTQPIITPNGLAIQPQSGPGGSFSVSGVPGGDSIYARNQMMEQAAKAQYGAPVQVPATSPTGQPTLQNPYRMAVSQGAPDVLGAASQSSAPNAPAPSQIAPQAPTANPEGIPAGMSPAAASAQAASAEQQKDIAKNYAGIYNNLQNASMANPAKIAKMERVGNLLEGFEGGKLSKSAMDIASAANSVGIKIDPKLPNKQAAEALSKEMALDLRSTANGSGMPGSMSDADREYLKSMTPDIGTTAQGRKMIVEAKVALLKRESTVSAMARQYTKKYGGLNEDFFNQLQAWSERNPIFKK
jgi:hypothetical protein